MKGKDIQDDWSAEINNEGLKIQWNKILISEVWMGQNVAEIFSATVTPRNKVNVILQQAEVAQGVPGSLRPLIFLTFGTTRVVGHQPYALAAFTPGIPNSCTYEG